MNYSILRFERFVRTLSGLRRRTVETHFRIFRKSFVPKLNMKVSRELPEYDFLKTLASALMIPNDFIMPRLMETQTVEEAEHYVDGIYNILGSGDVDLKRIDWHMDFKSGFRWPPDKYFRFYDQENLLSDSDVKVPRELSRCHHVLRAGVAYNVTKDEKFARYCVSKILDWIDNNPLMYSINWGCTMDVAIRAVNWIWTIGLIKNSAALDRESLVKVERSLYQHGWYIWRFPEKSKKYSGNHYLADLAGQLHLGLIFCNIEEAKLWLVKGKEELFREIRLEILPSGMSYERSTSYNRLVLELILVPLLLLKNNGYEIPTDIWYRLEKMFEFIMYSLKPDGTTPIIGDQDNGRLLPLGSEDLNDYRYLLSIGALLFKRGDFKQEGNGFNTYCSMFGGENAQNDWNEIPDTPCVLNSKAFKDSGIYILRHQDDYLLFNVTGRGLYPESTLGSHTHSDLLSFELFTSGKSFMVDPGSYLYTADPDMRLLFRSTKMHNTVTVDGQSQDILSRNKIWGYSRDAIPAVKRWESNNKHDIITASHNGYTRLADPVFHERTIFYDKIEAKWTITDRFMGEGHHAFDWYFHFDANVDFVIDENIVVTNCMDGKNIMIIFDQVPDLVLKKENLFISKSYGVKEDAFVLVASITAFVPFHLNISIAKSNSK